MQQIYRCPFSFFLFVHWALLRKGKINEAISVLRGPFPHAAPSLRKRNHARPSLPPGNSERRTWLAAWKKLQLLPGRLQRFFIARKLPSESTSFKKCAELLLCNDLDLSSSVHAE